MEGRGPRAWVVIGSGQGPGGGAEWAWPERACAVHWTLAGEGDALEERWKTSRPPRR